MSSVQTHGAEGDVGDALAAGAHEQVRDVGGVEGAEGDGVDRHALVRLPPAVAGRVDEDPSAPPRPLARQGVAGEDGGDLRAVLLDL